MSTYSKSQLFADLRARGIAKVTIEFSGGNDEGGPDSITATMADGTEAPLAHRGVAQEVMEYSGSIRRQKWIVWDRGAEGGYTEREATADEIAEGQFFSALEAPIYDRWGSFAGDFYVSGILTWDVATEVAHLEGDEEAPVFEHFGLSF